MEQARYLTPAIVAAALAATILVAINYHGCSNAHEEGNQKISHLSVTQPAIKNKSTNPSDATSLQDPALTPHLKQVLGTAEAQLELA
eukprot:4291865-Amphidinium_carterae.1